MRLLLAALLAALSVNAQAFHKGGSTYPSGSVTVLSDSITFNSGGGTTTSKSETIPVGTSAIYVFVCSGDFNPTCTVGGEATTEGIRIPNTQSVKALVLVKKTPLTGSQTVAVSNITNSMGAQIQIVAVANSTTDFYAADAPGGTNITYSATTTGKELMIACHPSTVDKTVSGAGQVEIIPFAANNQGYGIETSVMPTTYGGTFTTSGWNGGAASEGQINVPLGRQ